MARNVLDLSRVSQCKTETNALRVGFIGKGIQLSRTPAMHIVEERANGLAYAYDLIDPDTFGTTEITLKKMRSAAETRALQGAIQPILLKNKPAHMRSTFQTISTL
jgi:shikimate 5-dehydrogenase